MSTNPKAFICHATEDNARFVLPFARKLRENGVDAWFDRWEMLPGDRLVRKIFDEGLAKSDWVIVVLSEDGIRKPWVNAELDVAVVRHIEQRCRLLPVVLESCPVPSALTAIVWHPIPDVRAWESSFPRILNAIFGRYDRPELGPSPSRYAMDLPTIGRLSKTDAIVMSEIYRHANFSTLSAGGREQRPEYGIDGNTWNESLDALEREGHINATRGIDGRVCAFTVTLPGFYAYAAANVPDFDDLVRRAFIYAANHVDERRQTSVSEADMVNALGCSQSVAQYVVRWAEAEQLAYVSYVQAGATIWKITQHGERLLRTWTVGQTDKGTETP